MHMLKKPLPRKDLKHSIWVTLGLNPTLYTIFHLFRALYLSFKASWSHSFFKAHLSLNSHRGLLTSPSVSFLKPSAPNIHLWLSEWSFKVMKHQLTLSHSQARWLTAQWQWIQTPFPVAFLLWPHFLLLLPSLPLCRSHDPSIRSYHNFKMLHWLFLFLPTHSS